MKSSYDSGRLIGAQEHTQKRTRCVNLAQDEGYYDSSKLLGAQEHTQKRTRYVNLPVELAESDYDSSSVMSSRASTNYHSNRSHILY